MENVILVLDDEPAVAALVSAALYNAGYTSILTAANLREARQIWDLASARICLILADFSLPDGNSMALIQSLLSAKPSLQVVLMSGFGADALDLDPVFERQLKVIQKPFRSSELVQLVQSCSEAVPS